MHRASGWNNLQTHPRVEVEKTDQLGNSPCGACLSLCGLLTEACLAQNLQVGEISFMSALSSSGVGRPGLTSYTVSVLPHSIRSGVTMAGRYLRGLEFTFCMGGVIRKLQCFFNFSNVYFETECE